MLRALAVVVLLAALAMPAPARAANPFGSTPSDVQPAPQTAPVQTVPSTSSGSSTGLSGGAKTALLVGAGVILFGIAFVIVRDARRSAPSRRHHPAPAGGARGAPAAAPGSRGRPTGKASAARRRRAKKRRAGG